MEGYAKTSSYITVTTSSFALHTNGFFLYPSVSDPVHEHLLYAHYSVLAALLPMFKDLLDNGPDSPTTYTI